jgi:hypothetical protein
MFFARIVHGRFGLELCRCMLTGLPSVHWQSPVENIGPYLGALFSRLQSVDNSAGYIRDGPQVISTNARLSALFKDWNKRV